MNEDGPIQRRGIGRESSGCRKVLCSLQTEATVSSLAAVGSPNSSSTKENVDDMIGPFTLRQKTG